MTELLQRVVLRVAESPAGEVMTLRPSAYRQDVKTLIYRLLPPASWDKGRRCWTMPNTVGSSARLAEALPSLAQANVAVEGDPLLFSPTPPRPAPREDALPFSEGSLAWRHQRLAYWYLDWARNNLGSALLDCGMRTGKTLMCLTHLLSRPAEERSGLVVTVPAAVPVWPDQAREHLGGAVKLQAIEDGSIASRVERILSIIGDGGLAVVGWPMAERLEAEQRRALREVLTGKYVIADEVQKAKSPGTARSKAMHYISRDAAMRIGASGTPLSQGPLDAYGVFRFLDPGVFGTSYSRFRDEYSTGGWSAATRRATKVTYRNLPDLTRRMAPYVLTVTRDVLKLQPAQHIDVVVDLPEKARRIYKQLERESVAELDSGVLVTPNTVAKWMRLCQITSGWLPAADDPEGRRVEELHNAKGDALQQLLESCDEREPWVVFGRFSRDLHNAARAATAAGRPHYELSGLRKELAEWRAACRAGRGAVLCVQVETGGIGISLTEAAFCAYLSVGPSLEIWDQSLVRIHGPEQERPVGYYHISARSTIDQHIRKGLAARGDVLKYVAQLLREAHGL